MSQHGRNPRISQIEPSWSFSHFGCVVMDVLPCSPDSLSSARPFRFRRNDAASSGSCSCEPGWEALLLQPRSSPLLVAAQNLPHYLMKQKADVKVRRGGFLPLLSE